MPAAIIRHIAITELEFKSEDEKLVAKFEIQSSGIGILSVKGNALDAISIEYDLSTERTLSVQIGDVKKDNYLRGRGVSHNPSTSSLIFQVDRFCL